MTVGRITFGKNTVNSGFRISKDWSKIMESVVETKDKKIIDLKSALRECVETLEYPKNEFLKRNVKAVIKRAKELL